LDKTEGFEMEPRSIEYLPEMVDTDGSTLQEISWFLNSYRHKNLTGEDSLMSHIQEALKDHNI
jgi:hypothetical protein